MSDQPITWHESLGFDLSRLSVDALTGLPDASSLDDVLAQTATRSLKTFSSAAFMLVAIDNWEMVSRAAGKTGQANLLRQTALRLQQLATPQAHLCWVSGETFAWVLPDCTTDELEQLAHKILSLFRQAAPVPPLQWPLLVTVCAAVITPRNAVATAIKQQVIHGLAEAQMQGGNRHVLLGTSGLSFATTISALNDTILQAVQAGQVKLAYQPIISAKNGVVVGYEALARIALPDGSMLAAAQFMPLVEKLGLTLELDSQILRQVVHELYEQPDLYLAMNISGSTASMPAWTVLLVETLAERPGVASRLTIEMTETTAITNLAQARKLADLCMTLGMTLSFDDFCSGHTSMKHLQQLPSRQLKLDHNMIADIAGQPQTQNTVRALIRMAKDLGLTTVAEGIEDEAIARWLQAEHIDYLQGYLYAKPEMGRPWQSFETD